MSSVDYIAANPWAFTLVISLLGLLIGSFLNVVIHRLPVMMEREWRHQCNMLLDPSKLSHAQTQDINTNTERFDLVAPRSRCPQCGHAITALENIPILSYLWLKGRCSACHKPIALRYPFIELGSALLSGVVAWHFGYGWMAGAALLFTWAMIALSVIDFDHQLLPDDITLPLLWIGLLLSLFGIFTNAQASIIGAVAGYVSLWSVYKLFKWATGKEGMGYGDFKLFAAFGAWMGWQALLLIILLASVVGAAVGIALILVRGRDKNIPIPFGPYLAAAGWIALLWGPEISQAYLSLLQLGR